MIRYISMCLVALLSLGSVSGAEGPAAGAAVSPDYKLSSRDVIEVQVFNEPDTRANLRVSHSGRIALPMAGDVLVAGLTVRQAAAAVTAEYVQKQIFIAPQVSVTVVEYSQKNISVLGQVNRPAQVQLLPESSSMGIVQVIAMAGGFTRAARSDSVQVIRNVDGVEKKFPVNVDAYLASKDSSSQFVVLPDDVVFVPERLF